MPWKKRIFEKSVKYKNYYKTIFYRFLLYGESRVTFVFNIIAYQTSF